MQEVDDKKLSDLSKRFLQAISYCGLSGYKLKKDNIISSESTLTSIKKGIQLPSTPRKGVTLVTPFFVVYQTIKALEVGGEHIKIGCIFTGNLPVFPDFYRYFHL